MKNRKAGADMLNILFITDYVCPYCLVAKEALMQALAETGLEAEIQMQPYELTEEPRERVDTFHDEVRKSHYRILVEPARQLALDMKLPPRVIPRPYTRLAFEGWYYAKEKGCGDAYSDLMYRAYFIEEKDIGDIGVLTGLAERLGLSGEEFRSALEAGTYTKELKSAVAYAKNELQVRSVPTIYINGQKVSLRTYTKEEMTAILKQQESTSAEGGFCCGPEGCG